MDPVRDPIKLLVCGFLVVVVFLSCHTDKRKDPEKCETKS